MSVILWIATLLRHKFEFCEPVYEFIIHAHAKLLSQVNFFAPCICNSAKSNIYLSIPLYQVLW